MLHYTMGLKGLNIPSAYFGTNGKMFDESTLRLVLSIYR